MLHCANSHLRTINLFLNTPLNAIITYANAYTGFDVYFFWATIILNFIDTWIFQYRSELDIF